VLDGLFGLCVGDALGLPVQFEPRGKRKLNPVTDMFGYGAFHMPPGTWSDDSSLTFCLAESLCSGYNLNDIADKFCSWLYEGYFTPFKRSFDVGNSTRWSINRLKNGADPLKSGDTDEQSNGNGSLMRILPLAYFLENEVLTKRFKIVHEVSSITHSHPRAQIACGIYVTLAINLLKGNNPRTACENMKKTILQHYSEEPYSKELQHYSRILMDDIAQFDEDKIRSGGYVVETLEASIWCFLNHRSYKDTLLTAVNLGDDTDTTGAVAGGLAGIYYGFNDIPKEWVDQIAKREEIISLADRLKKRLYGA
jgi:ADP-ribosyl-[dinitrogen reductase] hydrolase